MPDPKAQVEQITTALVYKFMDDMDKESIELGGKAQFFKNGYAHFSWSKLMDSRLGGHERLALYSEALIKMAENPHIPQLFRNIFKDAFLPYRDPETLNLFLKEINGFVYDHSERLGDAYEYLLSVLGSQGDAGQFRTPRHIIDFIVKVVDPDKTDTILDPACGTAGFLISAFKHILSKYKKNKPGDMMTPSERKKFMGNFAGYDISPDMVRISLVNMYLHGFPDPSIVEYDTLTSDEKWDELYDCILANPPFMTPKGGIRPHKRFSVQATRSEVLFVDYIMEHLTKDGRAGVIVPEGIIFQSQTAYKELRKKLIEENYLYAVVSLPAGIFNPYSGVKTSILLIDRKIAREQDEILFIKVENDGFDLGAQRKGIEKNDLPEALKSLKKFITKNSCEKKNQKGDQLFFSVNKKEILLTNDVSLTSGRYKAAAKVNSHFQLFKIGELCELVGGGTPSKSDPSYWHNGEIPWISAKHIVENKIIPGHEKITKKALSESSTKIIETGTLILVSRVSLGKMAITPMPVAINQDLTGLKVKDSSKLLTDYLFSILSNKRGEIEKAGQGLGVKGITREWLKNFKIPLPLLDFQRQIVAELSQYQKVIDGAQQVIDNWKPLIEFDPEWPTVLLGEYIDFVSGLTLSIPDCETENGIPIISMNNILEDGTLVKDGLRFIKIPKKNGINYLKKGDLLFNWRNGSKHLVGKTGFFDWEGDYVFASFCLGIRAKKQYLESRYLWYLLNIYRVDGKYLSFMRQNINGLFNREELKILPIQLPPVATQKEIVKKLENERSIIVKCRELIELYETKIKRVIDKVWEE